MKNANAIKTPAAVKAPVVNATTSVKKTSSRPTEKIQNHISVMNAEKTLHWLNKTARTINNHWDKAKSKRKCTQAYWDGLITRYEALSKQAQTQKAWEKYCQSINKPIDHTGVTLIG
jgi:hypothetical protein